MNNNNSGNRLNDSASISGSNKDARRDRSPVAAARPTKISVTVNAGGAGFFVFKITAQPALLPSATDNDILKQVGNAACWTMGEGDPAHLVVAKKVFSNNNLSELMLKYEAPRLNTASLQQHNNNNNNLLSDDFDGDVVSNRSGELQEQGKFAKPDAVTAAAFQKQQQRPQHEIVFDDDGENTTRNFLAKPVAAAAAAQSSNNNNNNMFLGRDDGQQQHQPVMVQATIMETNDQLAASVAHERHHYTTNGEVKPDHATLAQTLAESIHSDIARAHLAAVDAERRLKTYHQIDAVLQRINSGESVPLSDLCGAVAQLTDGKAARQGASASEVTAQVAGMLLTDRLITFSTLSPDILAALKKTGRIDTNEQLVLGLKSNTALHEAFHQRFFRPKNAAFNFADECARINKSASSSGMLLLALGVLPADPWSMRMLMPTACHCGATTCAGTPLLNVLHKHDSYNNIFLEQKEFEYLEPVTKKMRTIKYVGFSESSDPFQLRYKCSSSKMKHRLSCLHPLRSGF